MYPTYIISMDHTIVMDINVYVRTVVSKKRGD